MESRFISLETQICKLLNYFPVEQFPEAQINKYAGLVAEYSHEINVMLKFYPSKQTRDEKVEAKSELKYHYDFIHFLVKILRTIELGGRLDSQTLFQLFDYASNRELLIKSIY